MRIKCVIFMMAIITIFSFTGCNEKTNSTAAQTKPVVAVTIVPQATFVKEVAGDLMDVVVLVPPGYSPESYQPSPKLMEEFSRASIYFAIGVPAEEAYILPRVGSINSGIKIVDLAERVARFYPPRSFETGESSHSHSTNPDSPEIPSDEHSHEGNDPHIWLSPKRVKVIIEEIARELSILDADNKSIYESNAESYKQELDKLDSEIKEILSGVSNKSFIMYHPSLGYFADDYGLNMHAIEEGGKDAAPKTFQRLIDLAKSENIKAVFYQAESDSRQSRAFAEEIGGEAIMVEPLSADYINNLRKIAETFAKAIEGNN
ncbi:MAG TPA: zinc ABC transporter solute-binding protein [Clostridiaceae bacterium]|nr:zinc ABC transporter solute-binding protein [Clostridiaceae bacterium]